MKDKTLKIKAVVRITLFILLSVVGMHNGYAYQFLEGDIVYSVNENATGTLTVMWHKDGTSATGTLTIPFELYHEGNYYTVTRIGPSAFSGCTGLTGNLVIPNTVTYIGDYAFKNCSGLTGNLVIPNTVTNIRREAFYRCCGFSGCSLTIPESVTYIGENAFTDCGFTIINYNATNCGVVLGHPHLSYNDESPFSGNPAIVNLGSSVQQIPSCFLYNCNVVGTIDIPNSVTTIASGAFFGCSGLTGITIPNSINSIGDDAFKYCSSLTGTLTIPNSVTSIGNNAFYRCTGFNQIIVESGNTVYDSRGNCNAIIMTSTNELMLGCKNTVIPNTVALIGSSAFEYCSGLTSINIPNSVTSIGISAFGNCNGLTSLTISNSVTTIGVSAFQWCGLSGDLIIPQSVTSIGSRAFYCCSGLSSIIMLSNTPPSLGSEAFYGIYSNLKIFVPYESWNAYNTAYNGIGYSISIRPMAYKTVAGYGTGNDKWVFIASPLAEANFAPTVIENMIPSNDNYDLYRFNQSATMEWENYKVHAQGFVLENCQGYLYANQEDVNIVFKGGFNEDDSKEVSLTYDAGKPLAGWNLVGNPFPVSVYADRSYYVMNADGTGIDPTPVSSELAIEPCTGVMVKAITTGQSVTFTKETRQTPNKGLLQIAVARNENKGCVSEDKAIVSFNEGDILEKFVFNAENAQLYIPLGHEDYAIAYAEQQGEMPLNFKATRDGDYTITIYPDMVEMEYLHLIDNMTGADVDLLQTPEYTFTAKIKDYISRFRLVFSANGPSTGSGTDGSETFAYYDGSEWVISNEGNATLQVVDALGRIVCSKSINGNAMMSTESLKAGVYVMRLMDGENVKTQKIVVR